MSMLTWEDIKKAELGEAFEIHDLNRCCISVYGGIGWPSSKNPGFAVVVAMACNEQTREYEICLLNEFESPLYRKVIMYCTTVDSKYEPKMWIADTTNDSAEEIKYNMRDKVCFDLSETNLIEMKPLYPFLLDRLKEMLNPEHRRLFLRDNSKLLKYLGDIEEGQVASLVLGDYPAIEALAFAVIELLRLVESGGYIPSHTGDWEPKRRAKTIEDLAYFDAVDDLDPDDEDDDYDFYHTE
jgi:hypothetical protein